MRRRDFLVSRWYGGVAARGAGAATEQDKAARCADGIRGKRSDARSMVAAFRSTLSKLGGLKQQCPHRLRWAGPIPIGSTRCKRAGRSAARRDPGQTHPWSEPCPRDATFQSCCDRIRSDRQRLRRELRASGRNITGFTVDDPALGGKWVELLKQMRQAPPAGAPVNPLARHSNLPPAIQAAASSLTSR